MTKKIAALRVRAIDVLHLITSEGFEQMEEWADGEHELIGGRIAKKAMPGDEHDRIIKQIIKRLVRLDPDEKLGSWWTNTSFELEAYWNPNPVPRKSR